MKIQAAVATGVGVPFEIRTVELDEPRDDEILERRANTRAPMPASWRRRG
jgi:Zn-dependent alcohol dehydrogenase